MEKIDVTHLSNIKYNKDNKNKSSRECDKTLIQFFYTQNNMLKFISKHFSLYELALFIKYQLTFISKRESNNSNFYSKKQIVFVELGANVGNELSYEHYCIILERYKSMYFIVPCSSSKLSKLIEKDGELYDDRGNKVEEYLIGKKDIDGFSKDTVIFLSEAKWINKDKIIHYRKNKISNDLYKNICEKLFSLTFPAIKNRIDNLEEINSNHKSMNFELNEKIKKLEIEIDKLRKIE